MNRICLMIGLMVLLPTFSFGATTFVHDGGFDGALEYSANQLTITDDLLGRWIASNDWSKITESNGNGKKNGHGNGNGNAGGNGKGNGNAGGNGNANGNAGGNGNSKNTVVGSRGAGNWSTLLQVIDNGGLITGSHTLHYLIDSTTADSPFYVNILGFDSLSEIPTLNLNQSSDHFGGVSLLPDGQYSEGTLQNGERVLDVNFGDGYNYLAVVFQANFQGFTSPDGVSPRIDNVSLTPEPASLSLLGLGGLGVLIRRRRR
jgi:hypothetical protein